MSLKEVAPPPRSPEPAGLTRLVGKQFPFIRKVVPILERRYIWQLANSRAQIDVYSFNEAPELAQ